MAPETAIAALLSIVASAFLTFSARRLALSRGVLDVPNERSSHTMPTPRGGGIAIVLTTIASWTALAAVGILPADVFAALSGGGVAVAIVGFLDDRYQLSARIRLAVHFAAAFWAMYWLGGFPPVLIGEHLVTFDWAGHALGVVGIVWVLNLYNFMDGIDGIAGSEAVFIACAGAALAIISGAGGGVTAAALTLGAASLGFLLWNWPPARIFMGDVGSGYIGYAIAVLAIASARDSAVALPVWLILGGIFFTDATVTIARRLAKGMRVDQAHRSHAYQWLARRWGSHLRVTGLACIVNLLWLLPCAFLATTFPRYAGWIVVCALAPVTVAVAVAGAGRPERTGE